MTTTQTHYVRNPDCEHGDVRRDEFDGYPLRWRCRDCDTPFGPSSSTSDPITFDLPADPQAAYEAVANSVREFGFDAFIVDTGGGVLAVAFPLRDQTVIFGGLQDGFAVVDVEDANGDSVTDGDGVPLTAAACIAAELVRRVNTDDLPG